MVVGRWVRGVAVLAFAVVLAAMGAPVASAHPPGTTDRVSVSTGGAAGDDDSQLAAVSGDGRFVAFRSLATTLVPGDTNGVGDVFVHDRSTGVTERVSVDSRERQAVGDQGGVLDSNFGPPAISADGRYVAFDSWEPDLVPGDTNNSFDVFVRDRTTGELERVSVDSAGVEGDDWSLRPAISADARFVAFHSFAGNLVPGDGNNDFDIFVRDRQAGTTVRASVTTAGTEGGFQLGSSNPSLSADGRVVAFESEAALVPEDSEFPVDVFTHAEP